MESRQSADRKLVEDFLAERDERSFRTLYREHTPALYRTAYRLVEADRRWDVEDLVQETWVRAAERLPEFEWRSQLRTWLTAILINCARESSRRARREPLAARATVEQSTPNHDIAVDLESVIARLPARARAVLVLHDIEGFTHEEIGELLAISGGTSKSQLFEARRCLRELLGGQK